MFEAHTSSCEPNTCTGSLMWRITQSCDRCTRCTRMAFFQALNSLTPLHKIHHTQATAGRTQLTTTVPQRKVIQLSPLLPLVCCSFREVCTCDVTKGTHVDLSTRGAQTGVSATLRHAARHQFCQEAASMHSSGEAVNKGLNARLLQSKREKDASVNVLHEHKLLRGSFTWSFCTHCTD